MLNEISDLNVLRVAVMGNGVEQKDRSNESANHSGSIEVTIVMPCLNEAETLEGCIEEAQAAIRATCVRGEVVVADNGSKPARPLLGGRTLCQGSCETGNGRVWAE